MSWIVLTTDDLRAHVPSAQVDALLTAALGQGQADPFGAAMPEIASRIRAEVRGNSKNLVSATPNAIPDDLKGYAVALIVEVMQGRLLLALNDDQVRAANNARDYLKRVAAGDVPIAKPDDPQSPDDVQKAGQLQMVSSRRRDATRRKLGGLL